MFVLVIISPQLPLLVPGDVTVVAEDVEPVPIEYVVLELWLIAEAWLANDGLDVSSLLSCTSGRTD